MEQRISHAPRKPLTPADVGKRIPQHPSDIKVGVRIPTGELTKQGHLKKKTVTP